MRDGRAGEVEGAGEVAHAHLTTGAGRDHRDQTQPYRVAERLEPGGERCRLLGADRLFGERRAAGGVKQRPLQPVTPPVAVTPLVGLTPLVAVTPRDAALASRSAAASTPPPSATTCPPPPCGRAWAAATRCWSLTCIPARPCSISAQAAGLTCCCPRSGSARPARRTAWT